MLNFRKKNCMTDRIERGSRLPRDKDDECERLCFSLPDAGSNEVPDDPRREARMIRVEDLTYRYDGETSDILKGINLTIGEGEYAALIGPNGCGKTTLVKHLNALLFPTAGTVRVDGLSTADRASVREIRRRVGMVFQNPDSQIIGMTVEEDVAFGPGNLALPPAEIRRRVDDCLAMVGMTGFEMRAPHTLSGGEKRLLAIAGVLATAPRYIAFDEPTAYLDPAGKRRVLEIMGRLNRDGMAIVHIAHDMQDVGGADRVVVMDRGSILFDGSPEEASGQGKLPGSEHLDVTAACRNGRS
jgi:biotin transport system ATP-binding protein